MVFRTSRSNSRIEQTLGGARTFGEERARMAWQIRHDARLEARMMMADPEEVELLRNRDFAEYGDKDGPTFEFLVNECRKSGLKGNAVYEAIIEGSYRTDKGINKRLGL